MSEDTLTSDQCRKARKLLGWQMRELWSRSRISIDAISRLERGEGGHQARTLRDLRAAFEAAGVIFQKSRVSLKKPP
jgi:transcriptional regulator with XRE-family HTH domain